MKYVLCFLQLVFLWSALSAQAHESQPGTLEIKQIADQRYELFWSAPIYFGKPHPARLELPSAWQDIVQPTKRYVEGADSIVHHLIVDVGKNGVDGAIIRFPGLQSTVTDIYVRLTRLDGSSVAAIIRPTKPYVELRGERAWAVTVAEYLSLGFFHILNGADHLLFVLGLLLIVKGRMMLFKTITSFTVAHSITLAIATLGYGSVPLAPLNAAVALSILFLGPEIVRSWRGQSSLTISYPWIVAFVFGLLHGFGFASGLSTTGMPAAELPWALLFFNVGVEVGQLVFVFLIIGLGWSFRTLEITWSRWALAAPGYLVGSLGAYWTIQRTAILIGGLFK